MPTPPAAYAAFSQYDTGWTDLTLSASFVPYTAGVVPKYRRIGYLVEVQGAVKPADAAAVTAMGSGEGARVFTLPTDQRPTILDREYIFQGSGTARWAGRLYATPTTALAGQFFAGRYAGGTLGTGTWLPFAFTYLVS